MRNWIYGLLVTGLLATCETRKPAATQEAAAPAKQVDTVLTAAGPVAPAPDTLPLFRPLISRDTSATSRFRPVRFGGVDYQLYTSAAPDRKRPLQLITQRRVNTPDSLGNDVAEIRLDTLRGFDVVYRFRLRDAAGKPVFDQTLRKTKDLAAVLGEDFTVDTDAFRPEYLGYLPEFGALAFKGWFGPDGSDVGGTLLLLLDARTGKLRHAGIERWFLGAHNDAPMLSTDGQALLTSYELLRADGGVVKFDRPNGSVAGSTWLNDQTILVAYAPDADEGGHQKKTTAPLLVVLDRQGKQLAASDFDAEDNMELGYNFRHQYVPAVRKHYFYDLEAGKLCVISRSEPTTLRTVTLKSLRRFKAPKLPGETKVEFYTAFNGNLGLYVDTVGGNIRYQIAKSLLEE